jgi:hypothetical protein
MLILSPKIAFLSSLVSVLVILSPPAMSAGSEVVDYKALSDTGRVRCGEFLEASRRDPARSAERFASWTEGFLMGLDAERIADGEPAINPEAAQEDAAWRASSVRSYCEGHPMVAYEEAVLDLYHRMENAQLGTSSTEYRR